LSHESTAIIHYLLKAKNVSASTNARAVICRVDSLIILVLVLLYFPPPHRLPRPLLHSPPLLHAVVLIEQSLSLCRSKRPARNQLSVEQRTMIKHTQQLVRGPGHIPLGNVRIEPNASKKHARHVRGLGKVPSRHVRAKRATTHKQVTQIGRCGNIPTGHIGIKGAAIAKHVDQIGGIGYIPIGNI
jgi:hypothetical protein